MSYPQFGYPYSSAPQVSYFELALLMWCVVARLLLSRLIISSIRARCFFTRFGQEPSGLTAAGRGEAASLPAITDGKRRFFKKKEKKKDKHEKETDPRPPVH